MARILYLYRSARREGADAPNEFGYGAVQLAARGHAVDTLDGARLASLAGAARPGAPAPGVPWPQLARAAAWLLPGLPVISMSHLAAPRVQAHMAGYDAVVTTTTGLSLAACLAKRRGRLAAPLVCLAMGIVADTRPTLERHICKWLLRASTLATLSEAEAGFLRERLGDGADVANIGFGIDAGFWTQGAQPPGPAYALAVGNDLQRDWPTLVAAWRSDFPLLRIVTRRKLPPLPANVEQLAGSLDAPALDDAALRALYRGASCVIVPLYETIQPSGQSVALQAMACGAPVVLTRTRGLWDAARMADGETCRLVPPGDPGALAAAVAGLLADPAAARALGRRGSATVRAHLLIDDMAARLDALLRTKVPA
jgi:hypothetical protein